jgi:superfamily II DNA or RNA helicase
VDVNSPIRIWFDRGTLRLDGPDAHLASLDGVLWDPRTNGFRSSAHRYGDIVKHAKERGWVVDDQVATMWRSCPGEWVRPTLRPYQAQAVAAWRAFGQRGIVCLPTGSGKTRVAVSAMAALGTSALVLCPTRALLSEWRRTLGQWYSGHIGVVGDGERQIEAVTVMTFESAYRHLDQVAHLFSAIVIDEVHHFAGGARAETLEMAPSPSRLGLTATAPPGGSAGAEQLDHLVGPVVCEVSMTALMGTHLAKLETICLRVLLDAEERAVYTRHYRPFAELYAAFARAYPGAQWSAFVEMLSKSAAGRSALQGYHVATRVAAFPRAKRPLIASLLQRHRADKTLVFTAFADDAYAISKEQLVPVITAEVPRAERERIMSRFRDGRYRAIISARVLNEGIDVPDANVAILVGGTLGGREYVQRIGRVLRPAPGKQALAYELVTAGTLDDGRARARRKRLAAA